MPRQNLESLGRLVREKRGHKKIRETAKEIEIGPATLMRIEAGRIPDLETFGKVCNWLSIDPGSFLGFRTSSGQQLQHSDQKTLTSVAIHAKLDANPHHATVQAIAQMVALVVQSQPQQEELA